MNGTLRGHVELNSGAKFHFEIPVECRKYAEHHHFGTYPVTEVDSYGEIVIEQPETVLENETNIKLVDCVLCFDGESEEFSFPKEEIIQMIEEAL